MPRLLMTVEDMPRLLMTAEDMPSVDDTTSSFISSYGVDLINPGVNSFIRSVHFMS